MFNDSPYFIPNRDKKLVTKSDFSRSIRIEANLKKTAIPLGATAWFALG
ncbi:MAG: hypothetical protein WBA41_31050 [Rivularia sp. (in: cyanobacteria)]